MPAKLTIKDMHDLAAINNGKFLSIIYRGTNKKHDWQCNVCNHIWSANPHNIKYGKTWCPKCAYHAKMTIDDMYILALTFNGKFLSEKYLGSNEMHQWQCENGHIWQARPNDIKKHYKYCCPHCAGNARGTIKEMYDIAQSRGGKCLSTIYTNAKAYLEWQCGTCNNIWLSTPDYIKHGNHGKGSWCPECGKGSDYKYNIDDMICWAKERGGNCLSKEYIGFNTKLLWECSFGHKWESIPHTIKDGTWCPYCNIYFNQELCRKILENLLCEKFYLVRPNWLKNVNTNKNLTLDGYCEKFNIAFEYNGRQHYEVMKFSDSTSDEKSQKDFILQQKRDKLKIELCAKNNTKLIIIPYWENKNIFEFIVSECKRLNIKLPKKINIDIQQIKNSIYLRDQ